MRPFAAILLAALLGACEANETNVDYDPLFPFGGLETYAWMPPPIGEGGDAFSIRYVEAAVHRSLQGKGYATSEDPDFVVSLRNATGAERSMDVRAIGRGDLVLEMRAADNREEVVWRGVAEGVVIRDVGAEERRERIDEAVALLFERFPPL